MLNKVLSLPREKICRSRTSMEAGGWNPVFKRRQMGNQGNRSVENGLFPIFVDELPDSMTPRSLFTLFNNFGVVKDAFILAKRRKATGSRFGFVRYDCKVAAKMAVLKTDGLWCDNKALKVKKAEFKKGEIKQPGTVTRGNDRMMQRQQRGFVQQMMESVGRRSFAKVVQNGGSVGKAKLTVKAYETGNGWLYDKLPTAVQPCHCKSFCFDNVGTESMGQEEVDQLSKNGRKDMVERVSGAKEKSNEWFSASAVKETGGIMGTPNVSEVGREANQAGVLADGPITEPSNLSDCISQTQFRPHDLLPAEEKVIEIGTTSRKGQITKPNMSSRKKKGADLMKQTKNKGAMTSNCFQKGAIFRAAAAVISLSVEQSLNSRRRNKFLSEAQATMEVGKILGLNCEGKEQKVISKLIELEEKDLERIDGEGITS
ncbi:hypothetical protein HYC85_030589 [Camellia sinensis]|uniref:RRM domain-containing protein n=1 Tax=Camellia sinensis TaxID=4442 RepID=A0A7J7G473_CAMSI|nr:hypothetical protein HYC85_030589 [Camellia sinensis]